MNFRARYSLLAKIFSTSELIMLERAMNEYIANHADWGDTFVTDAKAIFDVVYTARGWSRLRGRVDISDF